MSLWERHLAAIEKEADPGNPIVAGSHSHKMDLGYTLK
jgi:hypothetical protein